MAISVLDRVENIVGKGEIACTSNFSFSHNVFKRLLSQMRQTVSLCGNGLKIELLLGMVEILWEKEKMLVRSIFSYSHNVFKRSGLYGKELTLYHTNDFQLDPNCINLQTKKLFVSQLIIYFTDQVENIVEKGENAGFQHFLLFPQCFYKSFYPVPLKCV